MTEAIHDKELTNSSDSLDPTYRDDATDENCDNDIIKPVTKKMRASALLYEITLNNGH